MNTSIIPITRFTDVFTRVGWLSSEANSGKYFIWTSPQNKDIWTVVPKNENSKEYLYYQEKNVKMLTNFLGLEENEFNINDIYSQLVGYNYKLINRIVGIDTHNNDTVPFEMADVLSNKNIDAFRFYYQTKTKGKSIPIESFQLHHTQKGSFIIPISIAAELNQETLFNTPSHTNTVIRDYLKILDVLIKTPIQDEKTFADKMIDENIDSKIVKVFLSNSDSIAKAKLKYSDKIKELVISSNGSPIIDFGLNNQEKVFQKVDMSNIQVLPEGYLEVLETREIEADTATIEQSGTKIDVEVDSLDQNGTVKFSVFAIGGREVERPFKARSTKLTKNTLNSLTDAFKSRDVIQAIGDITKSKGKVGEIVADEFVVKPKSPTLFDEPKK